MKKIKNLLSLKNLGIAGLFMSLIGCSDAFDTSYFDKEINAPTIGIALKLGSSTYTAKELFEEIGNDIEVSETTSDNKSLVSFVYKETISESEQSEFIKVSNKDSNGEFGLTTFPDGILTPYTGPDFPIEESHTVFSELTADSDAKLTEITFSEGTFQVFVTNNIDTDVEVEFTFTSFVKNGIPFVQTFNLSKGQATPSTSSLENLNEYTLNLDNGTDSYNTLATTIKLKGTAKNGDNFTAESSISYKIEFRNAKPKTVRGDFGKEELDVESKEFNLDFFDELSNGNITFESPKLKLKATNGYGFPVGISLDGITTNASTNNQLIISKEDTNIELRSETAETDDYYAIIDAAEVEGTDITSNIEINNENSNIVALLNEQPNKFTINVDAVSNPNSTTTNRNFFDIDNTVKVDLEVEMPLHVTFDNLSFEPDAFEIEIDDIEDLEDSIDVLTLEVLTQNTIPLNGNLEIQFITINGNTETLKFTKNIENAIDGAPVDSDGFSTTSLENTVPVLKTLELTSEEIKMLKDVTHVKTKATFDTTNKEAVKIQSSDIVAFNLALLVDYTFSDEDEDENTNN